MPLFSSTVTCTVNVSNMIILLQLRFGSRPHLHSVHPSTRSHSSLSGQILGPALLKVNML